MIPSIIQKQKNLLSITFLILLTSTIYYLTNSEPRNWYKHYVYLADSFIHGRFDVPNLPSFYHDKIILNDKIYSLFPPSPALILVPFVFIWGTNLNQVFVSMFIGSLNIGLCYLLLTRLGCSQKIKWYLTLFFAFGTVHYYAAVIGTTWYYAHIVATFFLLLALVENFGKRRPFLIGVFFSLAVLSRQTIFLSLPFFLYYLKKNYCFALFVRNAFFFFLGFVPLFLFEAFYNWERFHNIFDDGHYLTYQYYTQSGIAYSLFPSFGFLNPRNIPAHLYTFFLMLPKRLPLFPFLQPSPYGLSVIIVSPVLVYALLAKRNTTVKIAWLGIILIAIACFCHFSQGWVQFSYRFLLDFLPFLMIITARGLGEINFLKIFLLGWSIAVNVWGVYWGKTLGW